MSHNARVRRVNILYTVDISLPLEYEYSDEDIVVLDVIATERMDAKLEGEWDVWSKDVGTDEVEELDLSMEDIARLRKETGKQEYEI